MTDAQLAQASKKVLDGAIAEARRPRLVAPESESRGSSRAEPERLTVHLEEAEIALAVLPAAAPLAEIRAAGTGSGLVLLFRGYDRGADRQDIIERDIVAVEFVERDLAATLATTHRRLPELRALHDIPDLRIAWRPAEELLAYSQLVAALVQRDD